MTRHSKNSTANSVYTYHERRKDSQMSGYGIQQQRLGKDSVKEFDCCSLTLQPCRNPVVTPDGVMFDKEAILEYIVEMKKTISRNIRHYEKERQKELNADVEEKLQAERATQVGKFLETNKYGGSGATSVANTPSTTSGYTSSNSSMSVVGGKLPSFWAPSETPQAKRSRVEKPDETVRCPVTGKPLKFKDLIAVRFTEIPESERKSEPAKAIRGLKEAQVEKYKCAVTGDVLTNFVQLCVLRPSGAVVTQECVDRLIRKDMVDPVSGTPLKEKDIIPLQRGASGFAEAGGCLVAKKEAPSIQA